MARLSGKSACLSRNGSGAIGNALKEALIKAGVNLVGDISNPPAVDFAICTVGKMLIRDAGEIDATALEDLYTANYKYPRIFTERHIRSLKTAKKGGLILHIGSNAARYGNTGADDYAAFKAALNKYLELRAKSVRDYGIRLSVLNLGAVNTDFWRKATKNADEGLRKQIVPHPDKALTIEEVAEVIMSVLQMPERVVVKDALVMSVEYQ